jgi:hypothetical protein
MEETIKIIGPGTIRQVVNDANTKNVKKGDVISFVQVPNGYMLIYFG